MTEKEKLQVVTEAALTVAKLERLVTRSKRLRAQAEVLYESMQNRLRRTAQHIYDVLNTEMVVPWRRD